MAVALEGIHDEDARTIALAELGQVEAGLALARRATDEKDHAEALYALATRLTGRREFEDALTIARGIRDNTYRSLALVELHRADEALATALAITEHSVIKGHALEWLTICICRNGQAEKVLAVVPRIRDEWVRRCVLERLAPYLIGTNQVRKAVAAARRFKSENLKGKVLAAFKDLQAVRKVLTDLALCGYPDDDKHIRLLHDKAATRAAIYSTAWGG